MGYISDEKDFIEKSFLLINAFIPYLKGGDFCYDMLNI